MASIINEKVIGWDVSERLTSQVPTKGQRAQMLGSDIHHPIKPIVKRFMAGKENQPFQVSSCQPQATTKLNSKNDVRHSTSRLDMANNLAPKPVRPVLRDVNRRADQAMNQAPTLEVDQQHQLNSPSEEEKFSLQSRLLQNSKAGLLPSRWAKGKTVGPEVGDILDNPGHTQGDSKVEDVPIVLSSGSEERPEDDCDKGKRHLYLHCSYPTCHPKSMLQQDDCTG